MIELGLNHHHQTLILSYMKFARYLRSQNLKQIEHCFHEVESGLFDDTYTKEEVKSILGKLENMVKCDMESELISFAHNNVLMLKQLFTQAEKWYLRLQIDISELQSQELMEMIKKLEADESQLMVKPETNEPLSEEGSIALCRMEIEHLKKDNERLCTLIQDMEDKTDLYKDEKNKLSEKLTNAQREVQNYKKLLEEAKNRQSDAFEDKKMEEKLLKVENLLSINLEESQSNQEKLKSELLSTKEKVKQVEAQLQLAELELERKFSETKAYANMKQILMKKNDKIKKLRDSLQKYEPDLEDDTEND